MRAAVLHGPENLLIQSVDEAPLAPDEVRLFDLEIEPRNLQEGLGRAGPHSQTACALGSLDSRRRAAGPAGHASLNRKRRCHQ